MLRRRVDADVTVARIDAVTARGHHVPPTSLGREWLFRMPDKGPGSKGGVKKPKGGGKAAKAGKK